MVAIRDSCFKKWGHIPDGVRLADGVGLGDGVCVGLEVGLGKLGLDTPASTQRRYVALANARGIKTICYFNVGQTRGRISACPRQFIIAGC